MPGSSAQAGPVVGHEDGVDGIGRIVFDAGRKAGNEAVEAHLAFEARDVLRGVIGHAGNGVAVRDQMARAQVGKRTGTKPKQFFAGLLRFGRMLGKVYDLTFGDAADLVQVETALAFRSEEHTSELQ